MIISPVLFETQEKLDQCIIEKKNLENIDPKALLFNRILSFQVELGELINEWRVFKYWSNNRTPRTTDVCKLCNDVGVITANKHDVSEEIDVICPQCQGEKSNKNPFLEEYVDCLHFLLSIGNVINCRNIYINTDYTDDSAIKTFIYINGKITALAVDIDVNNNKRHIINTYRELFSMFIKLGVKHLGFKWDDIIDAYFAKNKINHKRQKVGY